MNQVTTTTQKQPVNPAQALLDSRLKEVKSLRRQMEANRAESAIIDQRKAEFEAEIATLEAEKAELTGFLSNISDWIINGKVTAGQVGDKKQRIFDIDRLIADFKVLITALDSKDKEENHPILRGLRNDSDNFIRLTLRAKAQVIIAKIAGQHKDELMALAALMTVFHYYNGQARLSDRELYALTLGSLFFSAIFGGTVDQPGFLTQEQANKLLTDINAELEI